MFLSWVVRAESIYDNPFSLLQGKPFLFQLALLFFVFSSYSIRFFKIWLVIVDTIFYLANRIIFPGVGTEVNGSMRWIRFGPINIQPSGVTKFCMLIYISGYCVRRLEEISSTSGFKTSFCFNPFASLIVIQPDYGSTAILCLIVMVLLFFAGISFLPIFNFGNAFFNTRSNCNIFRTIQIDKIIKFYWSFEDIQDSGWQLAQSLISLGQGGWFGLGLGNSIQRIFFYQRHIQILSLQY